MEVDKVKSAGEIAGMKPEQESSQLEGNPTGAGGEIEEFGEVALKAQPPEVPAVLGYYGMGAVIAASAAMSSPPGGLEEEDLAVYMFFFFVVFLIGLGLVMFRAK